MRRKQRQKFAQNRPGRKNALFDAFLDGSAGLMDQALRLIKVPDAVSANLAGRMRTICFAAMLFVLQYIDMGDLVVRHLGSSVRFAACGICICIVSILCTRQTTASRIKKSRMLQLWVVISVICICSEILIEKRFWGRGVFMMVFLGLFFYAWSCMQHPEDMLSDLAGGVELTFWLNIGYCLFFVPVTEAVRYVGIARNPNVYMMYLLPELVVLLAQLYASAMARRFWPAALRALGLGIGLFYLNKCASRTGLIGILIAVAIVCVSTVIVWRECTAGQRFLCFLAAALVFAGAALARSVAMGTPVYALDRFMELIHSGEGLDQFSTGRISIYRQYLSQMNLVGHEYREILNSATYDAHNGILTMGYLYGILVVIPYCAWLAVYIRDAVLYWMRNIRKQALSVLPVLSVCSMLPVLLVENLEEFLRWPVWILFYFTAGILFQKETSGDE